MVRRPPLAERGIDTHEFTAITQHHVRGTLYNRAGRKARGVPRCTQGNALLRNTDKKDHRFSCDAEKGMQRLGRRTPAIRAGTPLFKKIAYRTAVCLTGTGMTGIHASRGSSCPPWAITRRLWSIHSIIFDNGYSSVCCANVFRRSIALSNR